MKTGDGNTFLIGKAFVPHFTFLSGVCLTPCQIWHNFCGNQFPLEEEKQEVVQISDIKPLIFRSLMSCFIVVI